MHLLIWACFPCCVSRDWGQRQILRRTINSSEIFSHYCVSQTMYMYTESASSVLIEGIGRARKYVSRITPTAK